MICKLCQQEKNLVEAHIIPKWAFMYLYPKVEKKRTPLIILGPNMGPKAKKNTHIGLYDNKILCSNCDSFIGKYDDYGKEIILERQSERFLNSDEAFIIRNVDFQKIYVFILSVLWRCSITTRVEFKNTNLGIYEKEIRSVLNKLRNNGNIDKEIEEFEIIFTRFSDGKLPELTARNILMPTMLRIEEVNFNILYLPNGYKCLVKTDKRKFTDSLGNIAKFRDGLIILKMGSFEESEEFLHMRKTLRNIK